VSELCRANVEDLWENRQGQLVLGVTVKGRGRSQQKIDVPIGNAVAERLLALLRHREAGPEDPLLVNQSGHVLEKLRGSRRPVNGGSPDVPEK
jgi:hypothetical protein